jgi:hypothetical protein
MATMKTVISLYNSLLGPLTANAYLSLTRIHVLLTSLPRWKPFDPDTLYLTSQKRDFLSSDP